MQTMKRRGTSTNEGRIKEGGREQVTTNLVALGDMICIKLHGGLWWPAQVVDENTVTESVKPGKRSAGEVLVRLYGSYKYLYVNPIKCRSEFERMIKQNNGSYREIFQKSLEKDLPSSKPSSSKNSGSKTKAKEKSKRLKPSGGTQNTGNSPDQIKVMNNDEDPSNQNPEIASLGTSQELSERRMRVMNKLGLTAPPGSPFQKKLIHL